MPESLHALIAARLDSPPGEERQLVQDASVLGKSFTHDVLAAVSEIAAERQPHLLAGLVAGEVLAVQDDRRLPERGQCVFLTA